jgi:glycosyltransferase involved in cell wall biosynthesis
LAEQSGVPPADCEVVLTDNACADSTAKRFSEFAARNSQLNWSCVPENTPGIIAARMRGIEESRSPIVLFVDNDTWMEKGYVACILDSFARLSQAAGIGGIS